MNRLLGVVLCVGLSACSGLGLQNGAVPYSVTRPDASGARLTMGATRFRTYVYVLEYTSSGARILKEYQQDSHDLDLRRTLHVPDSAAEIATDSRGRLIVGTPGRLYVYHRTASGNDKPERTIMVPMGDGSVATDATDTIYAGMLDRNAATWNIDIFPNESSVPANQLSGLAGPGGYFVSDATGNLYGHFFNMATNEGLDDFLDKIPAGTRGDVSRAPLQYLISPCVGAAPCGWSMSGFNLDPLNQLIYAVDGFYGSIPPGPSDHYLVFHGNTAGIVDYDNTPIFETTPIDLNPIASDGVAHVYGPDLAGGIARHTLYVYNMTGTLLERIPMGAYYAAQIYVFRYARPIDDDDKDR